MNTIIVAYDRLRTIGADGNIPWLGDLPIDMEFFRSATIGKSVIMGRKTYESLPESFRPLPDRDNIVLSMSSTAISGARIANSLQEAYAIADGESYVIGGASIYKQALPFTDRILATEIIAEVENGDVFFPDLPEAIWTEVTRNPFVADERNKYSGAFVTYLRTKPRL